VQGLWLASYVAIWTVALGLAFLALGLLKQFGELRARDPSYQPEETTATRVGREDGPELGSPYPSPSRGEGCRGTDLPAGAIHGYRPFPRCPTNASADAVLDPHPPAPLPQV